MRTEELSSLAPKSRDVSALTSSTESSVRRSKCFGVCRRVKEEIKNCSLLGILTEILFLV